MAKLSDVFLHLAGRALEAPGDVLNWGISQTPAGRSAQAAYQEQQLQNRLLQQERDAQSLAALTAFTKENQFTAIPQSGKPTNLSDLVQEMPQAPEGSVEMDVPGMGRGYVTPRPHEYPTYVQDVNGNLTPGKVIKTKGKEKPIITKPIPSPSPRPMSEDRATLKYIEDFNKDPGVIRAKQGLDGAENVENLATSGNPIAAAAIPTYMARASGEVGNLSEQDKKPFGGSRAILERFEASLKELATGQLTDNNKNFLIELSGIMKKSANKNLDRRGRDMSRQFSKVKKENPSDIFSALRPSSSFQELIGEGDASSPLLGDSSGGWSYVGPVKN